MRFRVTYRDYTTYETVVEAPDEAAARGMLGADDPAESWREVDSGTEVLSVEPAPMKPEWLRIVRALYGIAADDSPLDWSDRGFDPAEVQALGEFLDDSGAASMVVPQ